MPRRLLKIAADGFSRVAARPARYGFTVDDVIWAMGSCCALNRKPFDAELLTKQFPPPYGADYFIHAARALGFRIKLQNYDNNELANFNLPCLTFLHEPETPDVAFAAKHRSAIVAQVTDECVTLFECCTN